MDSRKKVLLMSLGLLSLSGIVLGVVGNSFSKEDVTKIKATDNVLSLVNGTITDLTSTAGDGTFNTTTVSNNTVEWAYNSAKANESGLATLVRTSIGNSTGEEAYIANLDPITTLESIDIVYSGTDNYLTFYGSIDGVNYERVITISASGTVNELSPYFYVKIASGERSKADLNITSITVNYSCNPDDYNKDSRDAINSTTVFGYQTSGDNKIYAAQLQTAEVFDTDRSASALLWTNNLPSKYTNAYLNLPRTYTSEDLAHYTLKFRVKADSLTLESGESGTTLACCFRQGSYYSGEKLTTVYAYFSANTNGWVEVSYDLSTATIAASLETNKMHILVNDIITAGKLYIDDLHLEENSDYPTFDYDYTKNADEVNDLTNQGISNASSSVTSAFSYTYISSKGDRSLELTSTGTYKWINLTATYNVDLAGKIVTFDYISNDSAIFYGFHTVVDLEYRYYYIAVDQARTGTTVSTITGVDGRTWNHVVLDVDAVIAGNSANIKKGSSYSTYQGIRHISESVTTYIDNYTVEPA